MRFQLIVFCLAKRKVSPILLRFAAYDIFGTTIIRVIAKRADEKQVFRNLDMFVFLTKYIIKKNYFEL